MVNLGYLVFQILVSCCTVQGSVYNITVNLTYSLHECETRFLSVVLEIDRSVSMNEQFRSQKLLSLAKELAPSDVHVGGRSANFLCFALSGSECGDYDSDKSYDWGSLDFRKMANVRKLAMTGDQWNNIISFIDRAGWDLLFNVNVFRRTRSNVWNTSNAELLLNYSSARSMRIPYFQLGHEPQAFMFLYNVSVSAEKLIKDFRILKNLLSKYPQYASNKLYGPDVSNIYVRPSARTYLVSFIAAGGGNIVDEISLHQYYMPSTSATEQNFLNVSTLESLRPVFEYAYEIINSSYRPTRIRLTETASCYGDGAQGLSNSYISGFLWLDKLGMSAQYGITRVFRQTFYGVSNELVRTSGYPNPDYYLSVLFKRLIQGPVFNVSFVPPNEKLRVYAHCARRGLYVAGALVVYYLNLGNKDKSFSLDQFQEANLDLYKLTRGDSDGIRSRTVKLNGKTLLMSGLDLPSMQPKPHTGAVPVEAQSFGFIVVPRANVDLCVKYYLKYEIRQNFSPSIHDGLHTICFRPCAWIMLLIASVSISCDYLQYD